MVASVSFASGAAPRSPSDMTSALEQRVVSGEGVMYPGEDSTSRTHPQLALLDDSWPGAFLDRIGETISVRVSPSTGCYEFSAMTPLLFMPKLQATFANGKRNLTIGPLPRLN